MGELRVIRANGKEDPNPFREPLPRGERVWRWVLGIVVGLAMAFMLWVLWYFVIQGHPTARQQRQQKVDREIHQLQQQVKDLQLQVDSLSLRVYEIPPTTTP